MLDYKTIKYFKMAVNSGSYSESQLDIACRCPICGDSKKKRNSKRLHLYKKGTLELVNCFNAGCSVQNKTMYGFLKEFYPELLPQYKKEVFGSKIDNLKKEKSLADLVDNSLVDKPDSFINLSLDSQESKEVLPTLYDLSQFFGEMPNDMKDYLSNRGIEPKDDYKIALTDLKIGETTYNIKGFLVIPLICNGLIYGFYSRDILKKTFITFISTVGYKVWNWFNINKEEPTYIFEAIFDALSTGNTNIIANLGAKIPEDRLKELKEPIFCLDNDKTGYEMSIGYAKNGHKVYIQPNTYPEKDFNELKLNHPNLDIKKLIDDNLYTGMSAIIRLKAKL